MHVNYTYCGDHFTVYTNIKSLCCTPDMQCYVCQFTSIKKSIKKIFASVIFEICAHKVDMTECEQ